MGEKVTVREYLEAEVRSLKVWIEAELVGRDRTLTRAGDELERRLDEMNRLRQQIESERNRYVAIELYTRSHEELARRIHELETWRANITGRSIGVAIIGGIFIAVASAFVTRLIGGS